MQLGQVSTTQIPIMIVNKTYYSFHVVITNFFFFFALFEIEKLSSLHRIPSSSDLLSVFSSLMSKAKKSFSNVNTGGASAAFSMRARSHGDALSKS